MFLFRNRSKLLEWQKLFYPELNKLKLSKQQLLALTEQQALQQEKIANDCVNLINSTVKPDVFFSRYDLLIEKLELLSKYENYIKFNGTLPSYSLQIAKSQKEASVRSLIDRAWLKADEKASKLKTEKGKSNQYIKLFEEFEKYTNYMTQNNINYLNVKRH
ncbi:MAG: hypothetical protein PUC65_05430 [Clostridiales bacterium]|nr:hypothetical protein [Clostridiales bacterium]